MKNKKWIFNTFPSILLDLLTLCYFYLFARFRNKSLQSNE